MSLLDAIVAELRQHVPQAQRGIDKGLEKGLERAREWIAGDETLSEEMAGDLSAALNRVELAAPHLAHLGRTQSHGGAQPGV